MTNDLRWNTHASNICANASRKFGFLRRNLWHSQDFPFHLFVILLPECNEGGIKKTVAHDARL